MKFNFKMAFPLKMSRDNGDNRRYGHFIAFAPLGALNFMQDYVCFERMSSTAFYTGVRLYLHKPMT